MVVLLRNFVGSAIQFRLEFKQREKLIYHSYKLQNTQALLWTLHLREEQSDPAFKCNSSVSVKLHCIDI